MTAAGSGQTGRRNLDRPFAAAMSSDGAVQSRTEAVLGDVRDERARQHEQWGEQNHPDIDPHDLPAVVRGEYAFRAERWKAINARRAGDGCEVKHRNPEAACTAWDGILLEEVFEALAEEDPVKLRVELVQIAAVACAWVEAIDRRGVPAEGAQ